MSKSTQASETLQGAVSFFGWESEATEKSARNRIASALEKNISTASGALRGTGQSLASLARDIKSENDRNLLDFMSAVFIGAGLLAKHFEKPEAEAKPATEAPAEAKPKAPRGSKRTKAPATPEKPEPGTIGEALSPEAVRFINSLVGRQ
jgi:hypothetical protein